MVRRRHVGIRGNDEHFGRLEDDKLILHL